MPQDVPSAAEIRAQMLLDPGVCYLNHGSYGACPAEIHAARERFLREMHRQPVAFLNPLRQAEFSAPARAALAGRLGARPEDIVGVVNTTEALNIVLQALDLSEGDEIITTDHEYSAMDKILELMARRTGARIRRARIPLPLVSETAFTESLRAEIGPRARVLFLSHVTSATALQFPIARIIAEARARGLLTIVDGAHAPGLVPLDLESLGADIYAGNCHKWLMAPMGAAFLWMRPEHQASLAPLIVSHGFEPDGSAPFTGSAYSDRIEFQGSRDRTPWFSVPAVIDWQNQRNWPEVAARAAQLCTRTEARVCALSGFAPLAAEAFRAPQMATMEIPPGDMPALHARLLHEFGIEIPCIRWQGRCFVRISVAAYTTEAECEHLLRSLAAVHGWSR